MHITFELPLAIEGRLRESIARGDGESVQRLLVEVLTPTVTALLEDVPAELTEPEFEAVADQLVDELAVNRGPEPPSLSDYAVSREGIYEDHP